LFSFESTGSFKKTEAFLRRMLKDDVFSALDGYAREGVAALASATPVDSGLTAASWDYRIEKVRGMYRITWVNTNVVDGRPIAIMLQYGHGTGTGGYVEGQDYINPTMKPVFDKLAENVWKAVTSA
jgi:hypothetical protein